MAKWILEHVPFIKYGFCQNYWVWFHLYGGIFLAQALYLYDSGLPFWQVMLIITVIAFLWELIEVITGIWEYRAYSDPFKRWIEKTYGGKDYEQKLKKWKYDSAGDITGTIIAGALSSLFLLEKIL